MLKSLGNCLGMRDAPSHHVAVLCVANIQCPVISLGDKLRVDMETEVNNFQLTYILHAVVLFTDAI